MVVVPYPRKIESDDVSVYIGGWSIVMNPLCDSRIFKACQTLRAELEKETSVASKINKAFGKLCEPVSLVLNARGPGVLAVLKLKHLGVCLDYRERRFQLVTRIGYEAALLFVALDNRTENCVRKDYKKHEYYRDTDKA